MCFNGFCITSTPEFVTSSPSCTKDGEFDLLSKGTIYLYGGVEGIMSDYCSNDYNDKVWEGTCSGYDGGVGFIEKQCPNNYFCYDGACVSTSTPQNSTSTQICYDEDGGLDYYNKGHFVGEMYQPSGNYYHLDSYDACTDATRLSEYFCYESGDEMPKYSAWNSNVPEGVEFGAWHTYNCADEGKICYEGKCIVFGDLGMSAEDIIDQEEQDSAEDLAEEIVGLDDDVDYYYGYGYYGVENTEGNTMGYGYYPIYPQGYGYYAGSSSSGGGGYSYGYGYNYGEQVNKSGKINKALNPKILPDNPLYIFKLAGKGVRSWFTFDQEKKAKLRMRYAAEKMIEANIMIGKGKEETAAKHMRRYIRDVENVQKALAKFEKNDEEKARRLATIAMRLRLKEQVLLGKVEREAPVDRLEGVKEARRVAIEDIKASAEVVEDPREVRRVFEVAMNTSNNPMRSVRNLEILEAVEQSGTSEATRDTVRDLKEQYNSRLEGQATELVERDSDLLSDYVERAGGDEVNYLRVLDNLNERVIDEKVKEEIKSSRERVTDRIENRIVEVKEESRGEAVREILGNLSNEDEGDVRIIREIEERVEEELVVTIREVRVELKQEEELERRRLPESPVVRESAREEVVEDIASDEVLEGVEICGDGLDNDGDGYYDCHDFDCIPETGETYKAEDFCTLKDRQPTCCLYHSDKLWEYERSFDSDTMCIGAGRYPVVSERVCQLMANKVGYSPLDSESLNQITETSSREVEEQIVETERTEEVVRDVEETTEIITETSRPEERVEDVVEIREEVVETRIEEEVRCTEDTWECGDWSDCFDSLQTRTCRLSDDCRYVDTPSPDTRQSCTMRCTEDTWTCGDWSECSESGTQDRTCRLSDDCRYAITPSPDTRQSCTPTCTEDIWDCDGWSDCSESGEQTRTCRMSYDCENDRSATPDETQRCIPSESDLEPGEITRNSDLTITSLTYDPTSITDGDSVTFYATVYNQAEGDASASTAYLYIDGRLQGSLSTRTIVSRASQSLTWTSIWPATAGDYTAQVCADTLDVLVETDETNNCSTVRIIVAEVVRDGRVSLSVGLWEDFVSFFVPVTRAFRFGSEVLNSN